MLKKKLLMKPGKRENKTGFAAWQPFSGGGSSLLEALPEGISLEDIQKMYELLPQSGLTIGEMKAIRRCVSKVKGG